jgi:Uma2 family endonuclease
MTAPFRIPAEQAPERHRFTVDEIYRMQEAGVIPPDSKFELLDGEIIEMPADGEAHIRYTAELNKWLVRHLGDDHDIFVQSSLHLDKRSVPEPDFYIADLGTALEPIDPARVHLAIEVALSSLGHDLSRKAAKYAENSLVEYWVVDIASRVTHVLRNPEGGIYRQIGRVAFEDELTCLRLALPPLRIAALPRLP